MSQTETTLVGPEIRSRAPVFPESEPSASPQPARRSWTKAQLLALCIEARETPDTWLFFSEHNSEVSARTRIHQLRHTQKYAGIPLEFHCAPDEKGRSCVWARWNEDLIAPLWQREIALHDSLQAENDAAARSSFPGAPVSEAALREVAIQAAQEVLSRKEAESSPPALRDEQLLRHFAVQVAHDTINQAREELLVSAEPTPGADIPWPEDLSSLREGAIAMHLDGFETPQEEWMAFTLLFDAKGEPHWYGAGKKDGRPAGLTRDFSDEFTAHALLMYSGHENSDSVAERSAHTAAHSTAEEFG